MSDGSEDIRSLDVVEQKSVYFLNDELIAVRAVDQHVYVSVRHLCNALGLDRYGQVQRIRRQSVLDDGHTHMEIDTEGGPQSANMLRVDLVPLWLSGINTSRIKDDTIRNKLEQYQTEAAKVLWEAFQEGRLSSELSLDDLLAKDSPAAQAYKMAAAIMQMARQQLLLEAQLESHVAQLADHEQRLEQVETILGNPGRHITEAQATQVSQAVKAVAMALSKQTKRNEYGGVYGELYRRYEISSYKLLPASRFDDAMNWLKEWLMSLTEDTPF
ncbi:MAG: phage antirepressor N-terminal domain-containing protein [Anaerolineae bacterium]